MGWLPWIALACSLFSALVCVVAASFVATQTQIPRNFKRRCDDWSAELTESRAKIDKAYLEVRGLVEEADELYDRALRLRRSAGRDRAAADKAKGDGDAAQQQFPVTREEQIAWARQRMV